jgi:hypothetical protein
MSVAVLSISERRVSRWEDVQRRCERQSGTEDRMWSPISPSSNLYEMCYSLGSWRSFIRWCLGRGLHTVGAVWVVTRPEF